MWPGSQGRATQPSQGSGKASWRRGLCSRKRGQPSCGSKESGEGHSRRGITAWGVEEPAEWLFRVLSTLEEASGKGPGSSTRPRANSPCLAPGCPSEAQCRGLAFPELIQGLPPTPANHRRANKTHSTKLPGSPSGLGGGGGYMDHQALAGEERRGTPTDSWGTIHSDVWHKLYSFPFGRFLIPTGSPRALRGLQERYQIDFVSCSTSQIC